MLTSILLQAAPGGGIGNFVFIGAIILVFYFFMVRPQQKKQKDQKKFVEEIKKGDMVVTIGGMHGKVYAVEDDAIILDVDKGTKLKFEKTSISLEASKQYAEGNKSENK